MEFFENTLEHLLSFFLMFSNDVVLVPLIVFGYLCIHDKVFYHGACLLLLSMVINFALKVTSFQIVTLVMGSSNLAFPSGHMLSSMVFYGWLAYNFQKSWARYIIMILLSGIGCGLIYNDYHDYSDILGSIFFALLILLQYIRYMTDIWPIKNQPIIIATLLVIYIFLMHGDVPQFVWLAYYAFWGFIVGEVYFEQAMLQTIYGRIVALSSAICIIAFCYSLGHIILAGMPSFIAEFPWFIIGLSPSLSCYLQRKIHHSNIRI